MIRHRALTAIAAGALLTLPLAACDNTKPADPTPSATTTSAAPATSEAPAQETPQQRVEGYLRAYDAAAAEGWKDTSYNADYLTPELAQKADEEDSQNRDSGVAIQGERKLSNWTTPEETDTSAVVEFCEDTSGITATKDGQPTELGATGEGVGSYSLTRSSKESPWLISEMSYYEEGTTCASHFGS